MATRNENPTPWIATHPGTILKYELEEREISQKDFAVMIEMQKSHLNELIKGKRPMTPAIADKIEAVLGISSVSLVNLQNQYEYDLRQIEARGIEEQAALDTLRLYDDLLCVKTLVKRWGLENKSAVEKLAYFVEKAKLPQPAALKHEVAGLFKKSSKTGLDTRSLITWKVLAETSAMQISVDNKFDANQKDILVSELVQTLHHNTDTLNSVRNILNRYGIVFCIEKKVEKASVDGYSFIKNGTPYIVLTKRFDRIDNLAFALMHEVGHIFLHYVDGNSQFHLSIQDYDNESALEHEANDFAANALINNTQWKNAPKVRVNAYAIQRSYTKWAAENGYNKWIVLGRIAYETGMYKFHVDESRKIA
ncbi:MAG: ImmA/IrrE family metallo-endopeptidase [Bacteroidaceae bacterium]|nr:ImmA/IrrE family metallo-endopeptidase [Bacteroidaceae bacterium]